MVEVEPEALIRTLDQQIMNTQLLFSPHLSSILWAVVSHLLVTCNQHFLEVYSVVYIYRNFLINLMKLGWQRSEFDGNHPFPF